MFGDIGHGSVLLLVGIVLTLFNQPLRRAAPAMEGVLKARYLLLMMGIFAAFCGLCYNDFMAIPLWAPWGTCYPIEEVHHKDGIVTFGGEIKYVTHKYEEIPDCTYLIGIDPVWYLS